MGTPGLPPRYPADRGTLGPVALPMTLTPAAIRIRADRMGAELDPAASGGAVPTVADVRAVAMAAGVVFGFDRRGVEAALQRWVAGEAPNGPLPIARGTLPKPPRVERIDLVRAPATRGAEDAVDFRAQGRFVSVHRGERIGVWWPPAAGQPGHRVDGSELPAEAAEPPRFEALDRVRLEPGEQGEQVLYAEADGALVVEDGWRLSVVDVLHIDGDVDLSTGHVESTGSVVITGSVRSSFRVVAAHDVEVEGSVEDAEVVAGGSLRVHGGVLGGDFGRLRAVRSLALRYAQNARIVCEGDVVLLDSDLASEITAGGEIRAVEGRGRLSGGVYRAARSVRAQELGSPLGAQTLVVVGIDRELDTELTALGAELATLERAVDQAVRAHAAGTGPVPLSRERAAALRRMIRRRGELQRTQERLEVRARDLAAFLAQKGPSAHALRAAHTGVTVELAGARVRLEESVGPRLFDADSM